MFWLIAIGFVIVIAAFNTTEKSFKELKQEIEEINESLMYIQDKLNDLTSDDDEEDYL